MFCSFLRIVSAVAVSNDITKSIFYIKSEDKHTVFFRNVHCVFKILSGNVNCQYIFIESVVSAFSHGGEFAKHRLECHCIYLSNGSAERNFKTACWSTNTAFYATSIFNRCGRNNCILKETHSHLFCSFLRIVSAVAVSNDITKSIFYIKSEDKHTVFFRNVHCVFKILSGNVNCQYIFIESVVSAFSHGGEFAKHRLECHHVYLSNGSAERNFKTACCSTNLAVYATCVFNCSGDNKELENFCGVEVSNGRNCARVTTVSRTPTIDTHVLFTIYVYVVWIIKLHHECVLKRTIQKCDCVNRSSTEWSVFVHELLFSRVIEVNLFFISEESKLLLCVVCLTNNSTFYLLAWNKRIATSSNSPRSSTFAVALLNYGVELVVAQFANALNKRIFRNNGSGKRLKCFCGIEVGCNCKYVRITSVCSTPTVDSHLIATSDVYIVATVEVSYESAFSVTFLKINGEICSSAERTVVVNKLLLTYAVEVIRFTFIVSKESKLLICISSIFWNTQVRDCLECFSWSGPRRTTVLHCVGLLVWKLRSILSSRCCDAKEGKAEREKRVEFLHTDYSLVNKKINVLVCVFLWYETDSLSGHLLKNPAMTTIYYNKWVSSNFENKKSGTNRFRCKIKHLSVIWLFFLKKSKENYASYDLTLRGVCHCVKKRHLWIGSKRVGS